MAELMLPISMFDYIFDGIVAFLGVWIIMMMIFVITQQLYYWGSGSNFSAWFKSGLQDKMNLAA